MAAPGRSLSAGNPVSQSNESNQTPVIPPRVSPPIKRPRAKSDASFWGGFFDRRFIREMVDARRLSVESAWLWFPSHSAKTTQHTTDRNEPTRRRSLGKNLQVLDLANGLISVIQDDNIVARGIEVIG